MYLKRICSIKKMAGVYPGGFVGVLPYSIDPMGKTVFLLGQERFQPIWKDSLKWSEFGGKMERYDRSEAHGAAREAYEESMSFLGTKADIYKKIKNNNFHNFHNHKATIFPIFIAYDSELPTKFHTAYQYVKEGTNKFKCKIRDGYFEKSAIGWFTREQIINDPDKFRWPFRKSFVEIVNDDIFKD